MIDIPRSAEGITKLLRSKGITTEQIIEITSNLSSLDFNFPNKEVFVLELIQDRWNDQKLVEYKKDYKIWELFNNMWCSIEDETVRKKLFKNLKFVPHMIQSLQLVDTNIVKFLNELYRTCSLINSSVTVDVTLDNGFKILSGALNLIQKVHANEKLETSCRLGLINELINLTDFENIPDVTTKISNSYCDILLLSTLKYMVKFEGKIGDDSIRRFTEYLGVFLFNNYFEPIKQLAKFIGKNKEMIDVDTSIVIFKKSITFLSKQNFVELEKIFTMLTCIHQTIAPELLKDLSMSKKSMSQEFLEDLLNKAKQKAQEEKLYDQVFWALITHILELDIEIGIKYSEQLMDLIRCQRTEHPEQSELLWKKIIICYTNAREYPKFLQEWELYCKKNNELSLFYLTNPDYTSIISQNITVLSLSQLNHILTRLIESVVSNATDVISKHTLEVCLQGLKHLSYVILPELQHILSKVFELDMGNNTSLWRIRFLIMEVYDNIIPQEQLELVSSDDYATLSKYVENPRDLFYYFFKLREYKTFNLSSIVEKFMNFVSDQTFKNEQRDVLEDVFTNWSSLVNIEFSKVQQEALMNLLLSEENIDILQTLFLDDNFFEESNLTYNLVNKLSSKFENDTAVSYMSWIPIQCFSKNIRIELINNLSSKSNTTLNDLNLINHLLEYPTFKSEIEMNLDLLYESTKLPDKIYQLENIVFERVWLNHISQSKDEVSSNFIKTSLKNITKNMGKDFKSYEIAYLVLKVSPSDMVKELNSVFIKKSSSKLSKSKDTNELIWFMGSLYTIFKKNDTSISEKVIRTVTSNIITATSSNIEKLDKRLLESSFLLYLTLTEGKLEYIFAQYMLLRCSGIESSRVLTGVEYAVSKCVQNDVDAFNTSFELVVTSLASEQNAYNKSLLELYNVQVHYLTKNNITGQQLFLKSLSNIYTYYDIYPNSRNVIVEVLESIKVLLVSKSWLFSQYSIELLLPMCLRITLFFLKDQSNSDDIFIATTKIVSNILLVHRVKISKRNHILNNFFCCYLELLSKNNNNELSMESAKALSRLIINFCEPSNVSTNQNSKKNNLDSKISLIRKSLRKDAPTLLIKYVHLSISHPFDLSIRKELTTCIYSIFDLLSKNEISLVNAVLDHSGKQYFKTVYADYTKTGKWRED